MSSYLFAAIAILFLAGLGAYVFLRQTKFGKLPKGERLRRIRLSPNYRNGHFHNQLPTPMLAPGMNRWKVYGQFLLGKKERPKPLHPLPSQKIALKDASLRLNFLVWLGHSSYYLQLGGLRFLVDPVLSSSASPFSFVTKAFEGATPYRAEDFPQTDCLLITHDHWDHLNKPALLSLRDKIARIICPLGVGAHLELWGFNRSLIQEGDWGDRFVLGGGKGAVHLLPARHFSGRNLWGNNKSLWASFAVIAGEQRVYFGGDSGYGPHFREIGEQFGPFDLAALENGQYNSAWPYVHMQPEESWQAACDLRARAYLPGHSAKFVISNHAWDEPLERIWGIHGAARARSAQNAGSPPRLVTPKIGEPIALDIAGRDSPLFTPWWQEVR